MKFKHVVFKVREARTFEGSKRGGKKLGFYFGIDEIPEELKAGAKVICDDNGKPTQIEVENVESGTVTIPFGKFVAYEPDERCDHGYNCWEKSNAADTIVKTAEGYFAKGECVEVCITSNGALPWFLIDNQAPDLRIIGNEMELLGVNGQWQRGTVGNSFFVYYKREVNGIHDVALVDADTESAKVYDAIVNTGETIVYIPLIHFLGSVAA